MLRSSLRRHGLTSVEVGQLDQTLEARSCKALAVAAATSEGAMRLARTCGLQSKVSQENFAKAWHEAAAASAALEPGPSKSPKLGDLVKDQDWEGCTRLLMQRAKVGQPQELLPLLQGLLRHLAERDRGSEAAAAAKPVLALASLYGPEAQAAAERNTELAEAEWRYRWMVRQFFNSRVVESLQKEMLAAYQADSFQATCAELNGSFEGKVPLEQKMRAMEACCQEHVLKWLLPKYGLKGDASGLAEMKNIIRQHSQSDAEVKRRQMEIATMVFKQFNL
ncbi:unnamed protein product [Effrenium voratum]|uniref:Uncharacterized protein n=1 Tax=Effrenium voratum TaxID=2562239 RepID=A0AA36IGT1_9DINO|nr:unnamed protein product [Effrenium voratum]